MELVGIYMELVGIYMKLVGIYMELVGIYMDLEGIYMEKVGIYMDITPKLKNHERISNPRLVLYIMELWPLHYLP